MDIIIAIIMGVFGFGVLWFSDEIIKTFWKFLGFAKEEREEESK